MQDATASTRAEARPVLATALVAGASACFGLVPFFAKGLTAEGMAPAAVAFARFALAAAVLSPFLRLGRRDRGATLWGVAAGAGMGVGWIGYVAALETMPVALAGVLYMTYPVFTLLIAWAGFGDRPAFRAIVAAGVIVAAALLAAPGALEAGASPGAILLVLAAPLGFGFGINILVHRLTRIPPLSRIACVSGGAALSVLPLAASLPAAEALPVSTEGWLLLAGISLVSALLPQLLYATNAPLIGTARTAMAGSVELPTMLLVGWIAFGEPIGPSEIAAAAMIVFAIVVTPARPVAGAYAKRPGRPEPWTR